MDDNQLAKILADLVPTITSLAGQTRTHRDPHKPEGEETHSHAAELEDAMVLVLPFVGQLIEHGLPGLAGSAVLKEVARQTLLFGEIGPDVAGGWLQSGRPAPGHLLPQRFQVPTDAVELTSAGIKRLMRELLPSLQFRQMLPYLWGGCGLRSCSLNVHLTEVLELAQSDPEAAAMLLKGDLVAVEQQLHGRCDLQLLRRHAIVWIVADVFRTARLIDSVNDSARKSVALTDLLLGQQRSEKGDVKQGALLGAAETILTALADLPNAPPPGVAQPTGRPNLLLSRVREAFKDADQVAELEKTLSRGLPDIRDQLRSMVPQIDAARVDASNARKRQAAGNPGTRYTKADTPINDEAVARSGMSNETAFKALFNVAPLVGLLIVALRASQALQIIRTALNTPDAKVMAAISQMPWVDDLDVPIDMKIIVHLCRREMLGLEDEPLTEWNVETRFIDWVTADLSEAEIYRRAKTEINARKLLQSQTREAKQVIRHIAKRSPKSTDRLPNLETMAQNFDLSFRYRN
jgi:hypothetical protein